MERKGKREYMMIDLDHGIEFYLSPLETEGKSPALPRAFGRLHVGNSVIVGLFFQVVAF